MSRRNGQLAVFRWKRLTGPQEEPHRPTRGAGRVTMDRRVGRSLRVATAVLRSTTRSSGVGAVPRMCVGQRRNLRIAYRTNSGNRAMTAQVITRRFMLTSRQLGDFSIP
jgi:hypothetical protein